MEKLNSKLLSQNHKPGLYVVATPIGNMLDISPRALAILSKSRCVFSEDTRQSRKLLSWYGIKTKLISCHERNEVDFSVTSLIKKNETYAIISDAGTPTVSDPGYRIVNWCLQNGIDVFPIPGASSPIAALSASGMPSDRFAFFGFIPTKKKAKRIFFKNLENEVGTLIFFESPNRLLDTIRDMSEIFGNRYCCVCRELTKIFEEFVRGGFSEILKHFELNKPEGEFVILVSGNKSKEPSEKEISRELIKLIKENSLKKSVKLMSEKYNIRKNDAYKKALKLKKEIFKT